MDSYTVLSEILNEKKNINVVEKFVMSKTYQLLHHSFQISNETKLFDNEISYCIFLLYSIQIKERTIFAKIFDYFLFLTYLHFLGCPEHHLTIFGKRPSVCRSVCL